MAADILARIVAHKRAEVAAGMRAVPPAEMRRRAADAPPARDFAAALRAAGRADKADAPAGKAMDAERDSAAAAADAAAGRYPVIAEVKRRSPSAGELCADFAPAEIAAAYAAGGAACLSVLTDAEFFGGCAEDLRAARAACDLPVLRKDFMLNEWQVYESRAMGADAVLLIAAVLPDAEMRDLAAAARDCGMAVLAEAHDADELRRICALPDDVLAGINNRDLKTFQTGVSTTLSLLPAAGETPHLLVSESGIKTRAHVERLRAAGVDAFLIGESLMRAPQKALRALFAG